MDTLGELEGFAYILTLQCIKSSFAILVLHDVSFNFYFYTTYKLLTESEAILSAELSLASCLPLTLASGTEAPFLAPPQPQGDVLAG